MNPNGISRPRRALAYAVIHSLIFVQTMSAAFGATELGDTPMATKGRAKPNLILVVDDSGSMDGEFLPKRGFSSNDGALVEHRVAVESQVADPPVVAGHFGAGGKS